jgi:hypothetical protein
MGVGTPDDIVEAVRRGVDMFDCVMPTRAGRHGQAFTRHGRLNLRNARHADAREPLDEASDCPALSTYSRAYLHHVVMSGVILGMITVVAMRLVVIVIMLAVLVMTAARTRRICSRGIPVGMTVIVLMAVIILAFRVIVFAGRCIYRRLVSMRGSSHSWRGTRT